MADYKHVVILGVDGAGAFFRNTATPNIDRIFENEAVTYDMRVTSPTSSCPSWMSCLHGVNPEHHGYLENCTVEYYTYKSSDFKYPSFLKLVKDQDPDSEIAAIYAWIGINGIVEDDAGIRKVKLSDAPLTDYIAGEYLDNNTPKVLFVHFGTPDNFGHRFGYGGEEHLNQITLVDSYIGRIYDKLEEKKMIDDTLFIVTSDHGGAKKWHGGLSDEEKYVLFAAKGKTVKKGGVPKDMEIRDVSAVALYALGIEAPECYTCRVPSGLFEGVEAKARPVYYDFSQKRCHVAEPTRDIKAFSSEVLKKPLVKYIPFDNEDLSDSLPHDKITFIDGYFDGAVHLDDGYLTLSDFAPETDSFTIAAWVKSPSPHCAEPVFANKKCEGISLIPREDSSNGFVLRYVRNTYVVPAIHTTRVDIVIAGRPYILEAELPNDYQYGWMHLAVSFDRKSGLVSLYHDFKKVACTLVWGLRKDIAFNGDGRGLVIGQDTTESFEYKFGLDLDEFAVFGDALTDGDMELLQSFYK